MDHPLLAEREVLLASRSGIYDWVPCRVVAKKGGDIKVEFAPYDQGYKMWVNHVYVRPRQAHADTPHWNVEDGH